MASVNDKITDIRNAARPNSARATGTRSAGGVSLACDSLAGWPTASKVHFVTYTVDSNSNPVAGTQLDCYGIVSGNTIGSFTVVDGNDIGNSVGDYVEMLPTAAWGQDLADALTAQHTRTGLHTGITTDTITVSSGTSLPAGDIGTADLAADAVTAAKLADASVFPANLTTGLSGSTWEWQSWTPTFTYTGGGSTGNATIVAKYIKIGKTIHFRFSYVIGNTTTFSGMTGLGVSLPEPANSGYTNTESPYIGWTKCLDVGTSTYTGPIQINSGSTTTMLPLATVVNATFATVSAISMNNPFTWGTGDEFYMTGTYEAA